MVVNTCTVSDAFVNRPFSMQPSANCPTKVIYDTEFSTRDN